MKELFSKILSKNEALIYNDLLSNGESKATEIAKRTKLARNKVYDALTRLESKNLVVVENNIVKRFYVTSPEKFQELVNKSYIEKKELLSDINKSMPELSSLYSINKTQIPVFTYTRGMKDFVSSIKEETKTTKEFIYIFARKMTFFDEYNLIPSYNRLVKKGIDIRVITIDDKNARRIVKEIGAKAVFVPKDFVFQKSMVIKDDSFSISFRGEKDSMRIKTDSKELIEAFKSFFLLTWNLAEKK